MWSNIFPLRKDFSDMLNAHDLNLYLILDHNTAPGYEKAELRDRNDNFKYEFELDCTKDFYGQLYEEIMNAIEERERGENDA